MFALVLKHTLQTFIGGIGKRFLLLALPLALGGCAINELRLDYASKVGEAAKTASDSARSFLTRVDQGREDTNIALAVADPACAKTHPQLRTMPDLKSQASVGFLCVEGAPVAGAPTLSLLPIGEEVAPTLKLIEALAAYGEALAMAVDASKDEPPSSPLVQALELAHTAEGALTAVTGQSGGAVPATGDQRVAAARELVDFLGRLVAEADRVEVLRAFLKANPDKPAGVVISLKRQIATWETARKGDATIRFMMADAATVRVLQRRPPIPPDHRRQALTSFYAARAANADEARLAPALLTALDAVAAADTDLRRVIVDHPTLTARERQRIAALSRERIVTALNQIAKLATAIRGS